MQTVIEENAVIPNNPEIEKGIVNISDQAMSIVVKDNESFVMADGLLNAIKAMEKKIKDFFKPHKENAHKAWRTLCDAENAELAKLEPGATHIKAQNKNYLAIEEAKRQEEENRLRLEAQKAEEEKRLAESIQLEAEGLQEEAEAVLDTPAPIIMPTVEKTTPKADMRLYRKVWKFEVTDLSKLPDQYKIPNEIAIGQVVRALKEKTKIPGVRIWQE